MKIILVFLMFFFSNAEAATVDFKKIVVSAEKLQKLPKAKQYEYLKLVNQIMYNLEALQGPLTNAVAKSGPPFFLVRFSTAVAADPIKTPMTVGEMCLYGGWKNTAKKMSDGSVKCPRPSGKQCSTGSTTDGFMCNMWGFEETVCVPREPIVHLTKRCIDSIEEKIDRLVETNSLTREQIEGLERNLNEFAKEADANQLAFNQYCLGNTQPLECKSITRLINRVSDMLSIETPVLEEVVVSAQPVATKPDCTNATDCISCAIEHDLQMPAPSSNYMQLLEVMAHRCHADKGKLLDNTELQRIKSKMIAGLGYCNKYQIREGVERKDAVLLDSWKRQTAGFGDYAKFEKTFGMSVYAADAAFCGNPDSPVNMQMKYEKGMRSNRRSIYRDQKPPNLRDASGWAKCDMDLQMKQGRPQLSGVAYQDAVNLYEQNRIPLDQLVSIEGKKVENGKLWELGNPITDSAKVPAFSHIDYSVEKGVLKNDKDQTVSRNSDSYNQFLNGLKKCEAAGAPAVTKPAQGQGTK